MHVYDVLRERGHKIFLDQCVLCASDRLTGALGRIEDKDHSSRSHLS
jgi:hypothetical protein